jgi:hypothetical protein
MTGMTARSGMRRERPVKVSTVTSAEEVRTQGPNLDQVLPRSNIRRHQGSFFGGAGPLSPGCPAK